MGQLCGVYSGSVVAGPVLGHVVSSFICQTELAVVTGPREIQNNLQSKVVDAFSGCHF